MGKAATAIKAVDDAERMGVGGNRPPLITLEQLAEENKGVAANVEATLADARALPKEIATDEEDGNITDAVRAIQTHLKNVEALRVDTKAPFLAAQRIVDSYFNGPLSTGLNNAKAELERRLTVYKRKKAGDERLRREEEARVARETAEAARVAAEGARRAAEAAAQREREEAELAAAFDVKTEPVASPHIAPEVRNAEAEALTAAHNARAAEAAVHFKPAEAARNRSTSGAAGSTLVESWEFEITDLFAIPLDQLRTFIPRADIEKAVRRYVAVHKGDQPLAGVRVFPVENARVY